MRKKIKIIWDVIRGFRKPFLIVAALTIIAPLLEGFSAGLITPTLQLLINNTVDTNNIFYKLNSFLFKGQVPMNTLVIEILSVTFLSTSLSYLSSAYERSREEYLKMRWKTTIYENYIYKPYSFFIHKKQGELINNIVAQTDLAFSALVITLEFLSSAITGSVLVGVLLVTSFKATVVIGLFFATVYLITKKFLFSYSERIGRERIKLMHAQSNQVTETINGILQIKLFNLEPARAKIFKETNRIYAKTVSLYYAFRLLPMFGIQMIVCVVGIVGVLLNNSLHFFDLKNILPIFSMFLIVSVRLFAVATKALNDQINIIHYFPSLELVHSLLENVEREKSREMQTKTDLKSFSCSRSIQLNDVDFSYDDKEIFKGLKAEIPARGKVGILGLSGSGKTTLIYLLLGIYTPARGDILFDGIPQNRVDIRQLRDNIGVVSQDNFIFNQTIAQNIVLGSDDGSSRMDEIITAAKKARAHEFIAPLPDGYNTQIGEKGLKLSGGQRQRLAIARVVFRNPEILIFDEATSSLDKESENLVVEAIDTIAKEKTVIIISHDLTLVSNCDKILVLKDGVVCEEGTHAALMDRKKEYWQLYSQLTKRM